MRALTRAPLHQPCRYGPERKIMSIRTSTLTAVSIGLAAAVFVAGCSSKSKSAASDEGSSDQTVQVELTSAGCQPTPANVKAGHVNFNVVNKNASKVSEAELRSDDLSHILGEQENLTPGLSGGFALNIQPGTYKIACPGASQSHWDFTVTGKASDASVQSNPQLTTAVAGYATYVKQNVADLITHTQSFCDAINSGSLQQAELLYSPARIYYERIEPVAEIWGDLDTEIDGRWENPVTDLSQFMGFHRIEQLMWENNTLTGAPALCTGLVAHEKELQGLVGTAQYSPLEMAAGATDLINEAATSKISGEEERYSNVDLPTFKANVDGAAEVVTLLRPYLQANDASALAVIDQRCQGVLTALKPYQATPGYLNTGYVEYSTVLDNQRKELSSAVNAYAEALSKVSVEVS
jgi:iron uptake system component EfeO